MKSSLLWLLRDLLNTPLSKLWLMINSTPLSKPSKVLTPFWEISLPKLSVSSNSPTTSTRCSPRWLRLKRLLLSPPSSPFYSNNQTSNTESVTTLLTNSKSYSNKSKKISKLLRITPSKLKTLKSKLTPKPSMNTKLSWPPSMPPLPA